MKKSRIKKKKRFLVRNLVWNKHYIDYLKNENNLEPIKGEAHELLKNLKEDLRISYCIFSSERGASQNNKSFHFQGYLEFNRLVDAIAFNKEFKFNDIQIRKGSQKQAIEYVLKEKSKLLKEIFRFGEPKKQGRDLKKFNDQDPDIRSSLDYQRLLLNIRLKEKYYKEFEEIEKDFSLLFIKYYNWCKDLWNRHYSVNNDEPARVMWIYGKSGVGKTKFTTEILKEKGYNLDRDVLKKKASSTVNSKIWFTMEEENYKVLRIEEVRQDFPNYNDIIQLIDRGTKLETKGSHIINKFELIIFNSLEHPSSIFEHLNLEDQQQILRRIYEGEVIELIPDKKNYNKKIDRSKEYPWFIEEIMKFRTSFNRNNL